MAKAWLRMMISAAPRVGYGASRTVIGCAFSASTKAALFDILPPFIRGKVVCESSCEKKQVNPPWLHEDVAILACKQARAIVTGFTWRYRKLRCTQPR